MKYKREYKINSGRRAGTPKISISIKVEGDVDKVLEKISSISDVFDTVNNTTSKAVLDNIEDIDDYNQKFQTTKSYNTEIGPKKKNVYYDLGEGMTKISRLPEHPTADLIKDAYKEFIKAANEFLKLDPKSKGYIDKLNEIDILYYKAFKLSAGFNSNWIEPIEAFALITKLNQIKYELGLFPDYKPAEE